MNKSILSDKSYLGSQRTQLWLGGFFALALLMALSLLFKAQWTIHQINALAVKEKDYRLYETFSLQDETSTRLDLPTPEKNRQNFLVVGMRGFGIGNGDLLTDTIIMISVKKDTAQVAFISIPRDLYIQTPKGKVKINELYSLGYEKGGESYAFNVVKTVISQVTGAYINGMARLDFNGFEKFIDEIGGVDVYLDKPFQELAQWQGEGGFYLPKGLNHLNGSTALYFARSRFSTSDFDRARRQQLLIIATKEKLKGLGILSNPIKIYNILDIIGNHVKTDLAFSLGDVLSFTKSLKDTNIIHLVLSTQNYLVNGTSKNGSYILTPKTGNYEAIQGAIRDIFQSKSDAGDTDASAYPSSYLSRGQTTFQQPTNITKASSTK